MLYPPETTVISLSLGATIAIASKFKAVAKTLPCWWSVWFPPTSERPGAE